MFDVTKYFPRSIDSEHPSQSGASEPTPPDNPITHEMVHNLTDDALNIDAEDVPDDPTGSIRSLCPTEQESPRSSSSAPQLMIIYEDGDINSALHFLIESAHNPFKPNIVAMVLVEEKLREEIVRRILPKLQPLNEVVTEHPSFLESLEKAKALNLELIKAADTDMAPLQSSPVFVCECTHADLGSYPTGVTTFHTFRNNLEAIEICHREALTFDSVSVWNESLDSCYEIVVALDCSHFFLNCIHVPLLPISKQLSTRQNYVAVVNGYHFETLHIYSQFKSIVFPIGELNWPSLDSEEAKPSPIFFLNP
ncbi:uncharacterized protein [Drosophila kikkawai]|uniref:Uncharacterized protein n=1 Tax=Drosophila kikkawai TaxID=30033 RepID=A0A6P4IUA5_DROKI|nr:uncharacterized protein LOC108081852 [Drosophila kikkawai]